MSSLRNCIKRRAYKERSQPTDRSKYGLLEKHKDYVKRAQDYNKKQTQIHKLQLKAAFRNPDEFYFQMNNASTKDGVHISTQNDRGIIDPKILKVMKTQDLAYMHMKRSIDINKAKRIGENLHFIDAPKKNQHTVFVDDSNTLNSFDPSEYFNTPSEYVDRASNRPRKKEVQDEDVDGPSKNQSKKLSAKEMKKILKQKEKSYKEMNARLQRANQLNTMRESLEIERKLTTKGRKIKVKDAEGSTPAIYKWKRQRVR